MGGGGVDTSLQTGKEVEVVNLHHNIEEIFSPYPLCVSTLSLR